MAESAAVHCQSIDLSHGRTRYLEAGAGPAVILLHDLDVDIEPLVKERLSLAGDPERTERFRRVMAHMTHPETRRRYHMARRLPHIANSTMILWGTADTVNDIELGRETRRLLPQAELKAFAGAGHSLPLERPAEFNQAVLDFLLR